MLNLVQSRHQHVSYNNIKHLKTHSLPIQDKTLKTVHSVWCRLSLFSGKVLHKKDAAEFSKYGKVSLK